MKLRTTIAAAAAAATIALTAACGGLAADSTTAAGTTPTTTSETTTTETTDTTAAEGRGPGGGGGGMSVDVASVTTVDELVTVVQEAYGDGALDLHRGHQPVQDVLDEVLGISHDELHVRMEAGQNLAAVATDLGIDPQTLVDALVESWSPAVDGALASGAITENEADEYLAALEEAFTFRVTWDGEQAMPTFSAIAA